MERVAYDEFGLFHENAQEYGLPYAGPPVVRRHDHRLPDGRLLSGLIWGTTRPEVVLVHGGAQNAHTWDTVALALGRPAFAIDLPGHGHSDWRDDGTYAPSQLADDLAGVIAEIAPSASLIVGMSLGGMTVMELAARHPHLVQRLVMVDITPGVNRAKTKAILDFVDGPQSFPSFDDLLARTKEHNPTRTESSLRRGILHNARQLDDGSWQWRYDRGSHARAAAVAADAGSTGDAEPRDVDDTVAAMSPLWDDFAAITCPIMLVRGSVSPVVDDEDVAESLRRQPSLRVEVVDGAGHSVQGDRPVELAALLADFTTA